MSNEMDHLKASVAAQTEVSAGVAVLLADLSKRLRDAVLSDDLLEVENIADQIDANTDALKAAVAANTPAAEPAPAPAPEPAPAPVEPAPTPVDPAPAPVEPTV